MHRTGAEESFSMPQSKSMRIALLFCIIKKIRMKVHGIKIKPAPGATGVWQAIFKAKWGVTAILLAILAWMLY